MKVQRLQKMQLKKATISRITQMTSMLIKGGTRPGDPTHFPNTGQETHCADVVCF
ncbi:hypothetical protein KORDIASMS9_01570 [Kordia sp. SMS9]|nr:hypothetical protein KORDIASMS9_01570 [Kordia sp. SMS9]